MGLSDCPWEKTSSENMRNLRMWAKPLDSCIIMKRKMNPHGVWNEISFPNHHFLAGENSTIVHGNQEDRNSTVATIQQLQTGHCRTCVISSALLCWGKPLLIQEKNGGGLGQGTHPQTSMHCMNVYIFHAGLDIYIFWIYRCFNPHESKIYKLGIYAYILNILR